MSHKLKLFILLYFLTSTLGEITTNIKNCLYEIALRHLFHEKDLTVSSRFLGDNYEHNRSQSDTKNSNYVNTEISQLILKDLFILQQWRLQIFKINSNTTCISVPGRNHEAYIVLSAENKTEDIIRELKEQFSVLIKDKAWNPRAKFVVLVEHKHEGENCQKSLAQTIFSQLWKYFIVNVVVLIHSSELSGSDLMLNIYTWFPYDPPGRCADIYQPALLDTCINQGENLHFLKNTTLFPNKLTKNLHGCKLRISAFELGPMTFKKITYENGSNEFLEGVEVELLKMMGKNLNMSIYYMPRSDEALWGVQFENGSWNGITGEVIRNYSDVAAANIWYKCHIVHQVDCLTIHSIDRVTWFVPCGQPYPRWSSLTRVFKSSLWLGLLSAYIIVSYIMHHVVVLSERFTTEKPENYSFHGKIKVFLNFWAVILEESASNNPQHNFSIRSLFLAWVLYCWAVNNVYQTFLTSFLIDPGFQHQISTEDELLTSGALKYGYDIDTQAVIPGLTEERYKHHAICSNFHECQQRLLKTQNFAFAFGKIVSDYEIAAHYMNADGKPLICQVEDVVLNQLSSLAVMKGYPLLHIFNSIVRRALEAGLVEKWFEDVKYAAILTSARNFKVPPGEYITLSLEHLQSAFYFLFIGYVFGILAFLGEFMYYSRVKNS